MNSYVQIEGRGLVYWPKCVVPNCPNRCCLALDSVRCYPHTLGLSNEIIDSMKHEDEQTVPEYGVCHE